MKLEEHGLVKILRRLRISQYNKEIMITKEGTTKHEESHIHKTRSNPKPDTEGTVINVQLTNP